MITINDLQPTTMIDFDRLSYSEAFDLHYHSEDAEVRMKAGERLFQFTDGLPF